MNQRQQDKAELGIIGGGSKRSMPHSSCRSDLGGVKDGEFNAIVFNPDFPLGASSTLFERWRRIFGYFFRSSLQIASYFRLIHVKTTSKSASTIVSNPNENSGFNWSLLTSTANLNPAKKNTVPSQESRPLCFSGVSQNSA